MTTVAERGVAIIDVRCMYVSCERVFQPALRGRPVVVLSNNDGCVVSRSAEATRLGVPMGQPWHLARRNPLWRDVIARSSNYELYGDMSQRFFAAVSSLVPHLEMYSIDECFVPLPHRRAHFGRTVQERVYQWTGLPVAIGAGPTKTLAKLAQHWAKLSPETEGRLDVSSWSQERLTQAMEHTEVSTVWGIGPQLSATLRERGVQSVADLAKVPPSQAKRWQSIVLERTVRELTGQPCIPMGKAPASRGQVYYSRMFGTPVSEAREIREVLAQYAIRATERLRPQQMKASLIVVSLATSTRSTQHVNFQAPSVLSPATNDPLTIAEHARDLATQVPTQVTYARAGVLLGGLVPADSHQLFDVDDTRETLATNMEEVRRKFGRKSLGYGTSAAGARWDMRRDHLSAAYTTQWHDLPTVRTDPPNPNAPVRAATHLPDAGI